MKVLICGNVLNDGDWKILLDRLKDLQKSSHGPFDLLVLGGLLSITSNTQLKQIEDQLMTLRLSTIAFESLIDHQSRSTDHNSFEFILVLKKSIGLYQTQDNLSISYFFSLNPAKEDLDHLYSQIDTVGFRGCDFCVSNFWPMSSDTGLTNESMLTLHQSSLQKTNQNTNAVLPLFINKLHPRYVFLSNLGGYYQRPPFPIPFSNNAFQESSSTTPSLSKLFCRIITLDKVSSSKDKNHKYLHALSLSPLLFMKKEEVEVEPSDATPNPYDLYQQESRPLKRQRPGDKNELASHFVATGGKPLPTTSHHFPTPPQGGAQSFFFGAVPNAPALTTPAVPQQRGSGGGGGEGNGRRLFVGGLGQHVYERELEQVFPTATSVRRVRDKGYAFADFATSEEALRFFTFAQENDGTIKAFGRQLTVNWATTSNSTTSNNSTNNTAPPRHPSSGPAVTIDTLLQDDTVLTPPHHSCSALFVGNIPSPSQREGGVTSEEEDYEGQVKQALTQFFPSSQRIQYKVRQHPHYAFIEFESHHIAADVLKTFYDEWRQYKTTTASTSSEVGRKRKLEQESGDDANKEEKEEVSSPPPYQLFGSHSIILRWASGTGHGQVRDKAVNTWRLLDEQPSDCHVIFLGNLHTTSSEEITRVLREEYHMSEEVLKRDVTSLRHPEGRDYAFLELRDPRTAADVMKHLLTQYHERKQRQQKTSDDVTSPADSGNGVTITLGWAKGKAAERQLQSENCWFCLASPTVKLHLVVSVGEFAYLALPKGGVTSQHVLIIPIDCVPNRLHLSVSCKKEVERFIAALTQLVEQRLGMSYLLFERSIRTTNGRDHMQIQMIPYERRQSHTHTALSDFQRKCEEYSLDFQELEADVELDDYLVSSSDGPYQEYFYIDLPDDEKSGSSGRRKFVYVRSDPKQRFPMSFGNEVASLVIEQPDRGFWKNCVVSEDEEVTMVERFREEFSPYDFTLQE